MATINLYPNGVGAETSITSVSGSGAHWSAVDEAVANDNTDYVYCGGTSYLRDLYTFEDLPDPPGTVDAVTIYFRIWQTPGAMSQAKAKPSQKSGATVTDGTEVFTGPTPGTWVSFSQTYTANPATGQAYSWAEVNALQVGVSLNANAASTYLIVCTQVYIKVKYHSVVVTQALTRVTALLHYYSRTKGLYRLSVNMGGLAPLMMPYIESKNPIVTPAAVVPPVVPPAVPPVAPPAGSNPVDSAQVYTPPSYVPPAATPAATPYYSPPPSAPGSGQPLNGGQGGFMPDLPVVAPYVPAIDSGIAFNGGRGGFMPDLPNIVIPPPPPPADFGSSGGSGSGAPSTGGFQPDLPDVGPYTPPADSGIASNGGRGGFVDW